MKKTVKLLLVGMLVFGLLAAMAGCGGQAADKKDDAANNAAKKLVVGTNATFPPFEAIENNEKVGFDMDLIRAIGEVEGYEVEIKHMDFKALIPALQTGKIDCAIAGMSITPERLDSIDFSDPYFDAGLIVAVKSENNTIKGLADLKGKSIGAQTGTIGANACENVKKEDPTTTVKNFDDVGVAFMELQKGGIDAVVNDQAVTLNYMQTTKDAQVKTVGEVFQADDHYGIGVKKGNDTIKNMLNDGLKKLKENGKYQEIHDKWIKS
ncbi:MAG TPA: basic amino acid ABC transporter substrate-binding protein [Syntrophomonas sp.]|jgi:polar amino acid transport system substrate-binding protein|nr:basic amino acid ABC transporter substrate-binding protein [Syntrophomonas sp.]HCF70281.1 basic amino acid ABC transporter substrate-binding protein [Syntrophomonas sp.]